MCIIEMIFRRVFMRIIKEIFIRLVPVVVNIIMLICMLYSDSIRDCIGYIFATVVLNSIMSQSLFRD